MRRRDHVRMKILLAVDGSKNSLAGVDFLIKHADWYREKLRSADAPRCARSHALHSARRARSRPAAEHRGICARSRPAARRAAGSADGIRETARGGARAGGPRRSEIAVFHAGRPQCPRAGGLHLLALARRRMAAHRRIAGRHRPTGRVRALPYFLTPLGVFAHSLANPDFRAEGTRNALGIPSPIRGFPSWSVVRHY